MGYRIVYGPVEDIRPRPKSDRRLRVMIAFAFLLFAIFLRMHWQDGAEMLREVLLPGDLTVAEQAFSEMVVGLRNGEGMADALTAFCQKIVDGPY